MPFSPTERPIERFKVEKINFLFGKRRQDKVRIFNLNALDLSLWPLIFVF